MHHDHTNLHPDPATFGADAAALARKRATRKRRFAIFGSVAAVTAIAAALYWYTAARFREDTDDAYVAGNVVQIAAQTAGTVIDVLAADTQRVRAGQPLVQLDDAEASVALAQAKAQLAQAVRQTANARYSATMYAEAVKARQADLDLAQRALAARDHASVEVVSPEELARARAAVTGAQAQLGAAQAQLDAARAMGSRLAVEDNPGVIQAVAQFKLAWRNLKRTTIVAPIDGVVGQRTVQIGQQVGPGLALLSLVQLHGLWVEANFKEGQIRNMRVGQPVIINSDIYGSKVSYRGRVEGFSAGTGSAFSMLPPQNAAGNWIKVVQRVPVVISIDPDDLAAHPLRIGLSMKVRVDTHERDGHLLDSDTPLAALATRVHDGVASEAQAAAEKVIRENRGN
ncbi:HlyD family efflux transporter periplasmic adaptor subunit [Paraburkholderia sp. Ac-20340]|uniref:HlyD family secretion protein n=1 Tax=Paraburkholderia sp. Ac-20340 TaxID=2703888 RepID=UPI001982525E|nr:efflux RND transporter periplasmic adaptor subunit [Paraburkholderia sp. Ac-20340]MBN3851778.1 HlyD family efflux transporter periplasmic adaptor subunit [Paraburkholderia sp. Ac-20340]